MMSLVNHQFFFAEIHKSCQRTLPSLELPRVVAVATGPFSPISDGGPPSHENQERTKVGTFDGSASLIQHNGRQRQKFQDLAQDISIQLLEKFSLVTTFAQETTPHFNSDVFGANERRNHDQTPHPYPSIVASNDVKEVPNEIPIASDPLEGNLGSVKVLQELFPEPGRLQFIYADLGDAKWYPVAYVGEITLDPLK
ncbi:putative UDP-arabinose 4-epimerase 3 [Camellia lanceoleosa]|uniref:UDP-arabinose 4-epimerase 3 n=1 Tax=Camellia lanceoleosa TaxID=1840588 RepID=A0ACC0FBG1_9ERIC|nr:putative UDP-arabinose 4-epimerase 3 [Camellia lanceoleosa]